MTKFLSLLLAVTFSLPTIACDVDGKTGFLPENDLYIPKTVKSINGIDEAKFNDVIDRIAKVYQPVIESHGDKFIINRKWDDGTVNASAQRTGKNVIVNMFGGLARHNLITADGFAVVMCHELGHHLAGAPRVRRLLTTWASNEGQSDYFATFMCFKRVFGQDDNAAIIAKMDVPELVKEKCSEIYQNEDEINICIRASMAGKSCAHLLASLRKDKEPMFDEPSAEVVSKTDDAHPAAQCRLDTYFQGALCTKDVTTELDSRDATAGVCNRFEGLKDGVRPLCWYKPVK